METDGRLRGWGTESAPPACKRRPGLDFPPPELASPQPSSIQHRSRARPHCAREPGSSESSGCPRVLDSPLLYAASSFPSPRFSCSEWTTLGKGWGRTPERKRCVRSEGDAGAGQQSEGCRSARRGEEAAAEQGCGREKQITGKAGEQARGRGAPGRQERGRCAEVKNENKKLPGEMTDLRSTRHPWQQRGAQGPEALPGPAGAPGGGSAPPTLSGAGPVAPAAPAPRSVQISPPLPAVAFISLVS